MLSYIPILALALTASAHYKEDTGSTLTIDVTSTIYSCSSGVSNCPATATVTPVPVSDVSSSPTVSTIDITVTDSTTICPESSTVVVPPPVSYPSPVSNSTISVPVPPPASTTSTPVVDTSVPVVQSYTVIPITTCIPTTLYSTVPIGPASTPVSATSGFASGSGIIVPQPTSSPIIPVGAASAVKGSLTAAVAGLVVAALFL